MNFLMFARIHVVLTLIALAVLVYGLTQSLTCMASLAGVTFGWSLALACVNTFCFLCEQEAAG